MAGEQKPKPHAVCMPNPAQGHVFPMYKVAKLLYYRGFHVTFVNTEYNQRRLLRSRGPTALDGLPSFRFAAIPDGLPPVDGDVTQGAWQLCESMPKNCGAPFRDLLGKLNSSDDVPPVTCVVSDGVMSFTLEVAEELGIPNVLFWTTSACGFLSYAYYRQLVEKGFTPFKDESYLTNGYLDTLIDWIPGMKGIRLKELPTFIRTTNPNDVMLNFAINEAERSHKCSAIILNTIDVLERDCLDALAPMFPPIYPIGPLHLLEKKQLPENDELKSIGLNLLKEDSGCLEWLDSKQPNSVIYVNFGSVARMTSQQLIEFAWGLANSKQNFLWAIRPDLVLGDSAVLPPEFEELTKEKGFLSSWCPQEQILTHPSIGGYLTHCGWNSILETISGGVPTICWPAFAEQPTNCWFCCNHWGIGMEITDVHRDEVKRLVRELMVGEKGKEMKRRVMEWKKSAEETTCTGGSSYNNFYDKMVDEVLLSKFQTS
ncbi:7-deoxyloganetin glucosyltransferase-like [Cornus florida]|uniref:7-deoxyloganetin glucosyltransferase-like n=1 Tax=Cornus florida TaxID=4283 RepID=UPI00289C0A22|nr:7-deoxyloganetin glucosyltransferase-like [Cornus florida]